MKASKIITFLVSAFSLALAGCKMQASKPPRVELELIAQGFTSPVALIAPKDGSQRLFVVDQTGLIWILSHGKRIEKPFLDLRSRVVKLNSFYDERGLLGLAFHPDFAKNGRFYVSYSAPLQAGLSLDEWDHTTYISEFTVSQNDPNQADPKSERILLAMDKPGYNYEAGNLAFGPDGYLYIATGDSVRDPATESGKYAQDTSSLLGKILRINVNGTADTGQHYLIPADNPFVSGEGLPEIFAYGFRNPYRFSFDTAQDKSFDVSDAGKTRLFVADVGQANMEEVDLVEPGGNYGWPIREGTTCFNAQDWSHPLESCPTSGLSEPIIAYHHGGDLSAVIGGMVYRCKALPELVGGYIFGDWGKGRGHLFVARPPTFGSGKWKVTEIQVLTQGSQSPIGQLLGIGQDENGELYLLTKAPGIGATGNSGLVYKIVPPKD
ncbi:MAG TPA: PQQ-dependent sugar dehydrogenase [Anaerolineales bacterium]|nr:PQQ-dependent sugar dehydrogenase [Anaerolineales bacterium]